MICTHKREDEQFFICEFQEVFIFCFSNDIIIWLYASDFHQARNVSKS